MLLSDLTVPVRLKLSALWVSVMLCYIYGDIFGFFRQDILSRIVSVKPALSAPNVASSRPPS
jgi:hypothetical protein